MTTEDDFHAHLDAHPDDFHARLVFADWLEEHAGDVVCTKCDPDHRGHIYTGMDGMKWIPCGCVKGLVSDGRRERAAGYRALGVLGFAPKHHRPTTNPEHDHWTFQLLPIGRRESPRWTFNIENKSETAWFRGFCEGVFGSHHRTRRAAEDAAALAFANLPAARQAELLAGVPA